MIYTSGIRTSLDEPQNLEQLQDNKLTVVCEKLNLKPEDRLLDIGCGWGTLIAFANKNYGCDATGVTLAEKQAAFGNQRIQDNGCDTSRARILCKDYRDIPGGPGTFTKIVSLEMAEVRLVYSSSLRQTLNAASACRLAPLRHLPSSSIRPS
jgi:cyclopropane fatty-acyl-phospholipid synthase-like methyltransferase